MTRWLAAARQASEAGTEPTKLTKPEANAPPGMVVSVLSVLSEGGRARAARSARATEANPKAGSYPYGTACGLGDTPRTWTGRVVSLAEWRRLTEWERHGPNSRWFYGDTRRWEKPRGPT